MTPQDRRWWCRVVFFAVVVGSSMGTYALESLLRPEGSTMPVYVLAVIPFFFVQIFAEWVLLSKFDAAPRSVAAAYECEDAWASMASGTVQLVWRRIAGRVFIACGGFAFCQQTLYAVVSFLCQTTWDETKAWDVSDGWWVIPLAFVMKDAEYYVYHRLGHEVEWFWAGHSVHHSGDSHNLSTALRQSWQQSFVAPFVYVSTWGMFSPKVFTVVEDVVTLYQFWVHTCVIRRMWGWMEWIFVTPSHHRVHHDRRVHKNFGGVFILWDRIGGTFLDEGQSTKTYDTTDEGERCVFGVRGDGRGVTVGASLYPRFVDPVAQLRFGFLERRWKGPGWASSTAKRVLAPIPWNDPTRKRLRGSLDGWGKVYLAAQYTTSVLHLVSLLTTRMTFAELTARGCALVASLVVQGLVADGYRYAWDIEAVRLCVMITMLRKAIVLSPTVTIITLAVYSASIVAVLPRLTIGSRQK